MLDPLRREGTDPQWLQRSAGAIRNLIVIGGSAGGLSAIQKLVKDLPSDIPAAIVLLLHRSPASRFDSSLSLSRFGHIALVPATDGMELREAAVFIVPPGKTVRFTSSAVRLDDVNGTDYPRESINRLFKSAAEVYRERAIGVILTGMLRDGTDGLRAIAEEGGVTIVQNPTDASHGGMPTSAMEDWPVTFCLNLSDIGTTLDLLSRRHGELESGIAVAVRLLKDRAALLVRLLEQSKSNEQTGRYLRMELDSLRADLRSVSDLLHTTTSL